MPNTKVKHSKIRNTGLLFEFLLRHITSNVLNKKDNKELVRIIKKCFNENTELGKELALYNALTTTKFTKDKKADYLINETINHRNKLNTQTLKREKYNLIKCLKENCNIDRLTSSKVKNYKLYASIYKLFEYSDVISPEQKTEAYFNLVEHITTQDNMTNLSTTIGGASLPDDEDLRVLTYKTLLERFNQKYTKLSITQKKLLREYINNVSNTDSLKETLKQIVSELKKDLKTHSKNLKDKVVKIKMTEAIKSLDKFCGTDKNSRIKDSNVLQTMRYLELLKELKKSGNKKQKVI
tara:strand:- start:124 stop:1011 length:888 start_codon:yes stop_codon:yes gene_type:complete